ncbi:hypothetical protein EJV46_17930 [Roseococcus sp. SYP-B2431]|uniref:hypothetical protein n=1 Tax=Roseococcus sp. SYP-B2431 TaxID=2496640 RepID=UPI00103FA03D|nr:hypothetical protein [Roseococcus sp. SYP-B2431]TCH97191.1 hypothetical protein EJV46_17930 [Roseococcus sp. SYP-B2431]
MTKFRLLFGIDLLILAFAIWQCLALSTSRLVSTNLADGTRTVIPRASGEIWLMISPMVTVMALALAVLGGAAMLHRRGRTGLATLLLLALAVPVVVGVLLMLGLMILFTLGTPGR